MTIQSQLCRFPANSLPLPSRYFNRTVQDVTKAVYSPKAPARAIKASGSNTPAQKAGKRYEAKVLTSLLQKNLGTTVIAPWISFEAKSQAFGFCQPDCLIFRNGYVVICEVKLTHTVDAYWQLRHLYGPILRSLEPQLPQIHLEITKSFDPKVTFPAEMVFSFDIDNLVKHFDSLPSNPSEVFVLQWKP